MPTLFRVRSQGLRRAVVALLPVAAVLLAPAAQAGPLVLTPFFGGGNAVLFDPTTGAGVWGGSIEQFPEAGLANPLSLVSVVTFNFNAQAGTLNGDFEFTRSADLGATLFGTVSGDAFGVDVFSDGGQLQLDYTVQGGTGDYAGFSGYGLSLLTYDPKSTGDNNYSEDGLLGLTAVPEPGSMALAAAALLALALTWRRQSRCSPCPQPTTTPTAS